MMGCSALAARLSCHRLLVAAWERNGESVMDQQTDPPALALSVINAVPRLCTVLQRASGGT